MITITIGTNGRFGNQMFQYASLMGIADKQNCLYGINYNNGNKIPWHDFTDDEQINKNTLVLPKAFHLSALHCDRKYPILNEGYTNFHFVPDFFNTGDDIHLHGYFQTEKYFKHIESTVRAEFTFKPDIVNAAKNFIKDKQDYETVAIHVRRGDYLQFKHHGTCDLSYYTQALNHFTDKSYNFIVVTDDIEWAKSTFEGSGNFYISESRNQFIDMCIMTLCNHCIIANSTFSWWGAWLNTTSNKKVIAPSRWFGKDVILNTKDLYIPSWTTI